MVPVRVVSSEVGGGFGGARLRGLALSWAIEEGQAMAPEADGRS